MGYGAYVGRKRTYDISWEPRIFAPVLGIKTSRIVGIRGEGVYRITVTIFEN